MMEIQIYNTLSVIKAIADGAIPESIVTINEDKLKSYIERFNIKSLPGVAIHTS